MDPNAEGGPPKAEIEIAEVETPPTPARRGTADVEITAQAPAQEQPSSELSEKEKAKLEKLERKRLRQEKKERKEARAQKRMEKQEKRERREREKEQAAAAAAAQSAAQPAAEPLPETAQPETPAQPKVDPEIQASIKVRSQYHGLGEFFRHLADSRNVSARLARRLAISRLRWRALSSAPRRSRDGTSLKRVSLLERSCS